ncbi:hypothetical protein GBA52_014176 [Prunus armeniaca]|nr:hypothetical protein GBA52_014176 [Prunus armeniaca]
MEGFCSLCHPTSTSFLLFNSSSTSSGAQGYLAKDWFSEKHESVGHAVGQENAKEGDTASSGSAEIFPKSSSGISQGHSNEVWARFELGESTYISTSNFRSKGNFFWGASHSRPCCQGYCRDGGACSCNEADSSEASLTREQKLKAERLKRAKIGSAPLKSESLRGLSAEPPESGISSSGNEVVNLSAKEREGSSVPLEADISDKVEEFEKKLSVDDCNERRSKRSYRARSKRHEGEEESDNDLEQEAEEEDKVVSQALEEVASVSSFFRT